ncbi:MAG: flagellar hook capping FlgD N-terminal domain-containing protein [Clostridiaceae bacterium]|nr:flagellar hook capping FlgD N-terminal domain-containing protein [Clostridiaceae bacterium]
MSVNSINSTNYTASAASTDRTASTELGKDEFLKLLVTQMRYQDPLEPIDNTEYVSQLAQFSTLEHMSNMSSGISYMEALSMTGKYITATTTDSTTGESKNVNGVVDSVKLKSGSAVLVVAGTEINLDEVTEVLDYNRSNVSELSSLVGQTCKGYIYDSETLDLIDVKGKVASIIKGAYEDYAVMNGVQCEVESILSENYSSSDDMLEYLEENIGNEIDINVTDSSTGKVVPVTAVLEAVSEEDDIITVTLNGVKVPVDGIFSIGE